MGIAKYGKDSLLVRKLADSIDVAIALFLLLAVGFGVRIFGGGIAFLLISVVADTLSRLYKTHRPYFLNLSVMGLLFGFLNQLKFLDIGDIGSVASDANIGRRILVLCGAVKADSYLISVLFATIFGLMFYMPTLVLSSGAATEASILSNKDRQKIVRVARVQTWQLVLSIIVWSFVTPIFAKMLAHHQNARAFFSPANNLMLLALLQMPIHIVELHMIRRELGIQRREEEDTRNFRLIAAGSIFVCFVLGSGLEVLYRGYLFFWLVNVLLFCGFFLITSYIAGVFCPPRFFVFEGLPYDKNLRAKFGISYFGIGFFYFLFVTAYSVLR